MRLKNQFTACIIQVIKVTFFCRLIATLTQLSRAEYRSDNRRESDGITHKRRDHCPFFISLCSVTCLAALSTGRIVCVQSSKVR